MASPTLPNIDWRSALQSLVPPVQQQQSAQPVSGPEAAFTPPPTGQPSSPEAALTAGIPSAQQPSQPMKDYIRVPYKAQDGDTVFVYSTTGKRQPLEAFNDAVETYAATGKDKKGFVVLKEGLMNNVRSGFESVNQPIQQAIPAAGRATGQALGGLFGAGQQGGNIGQDVGEALAGTISTPEKAAATAGTIGGALATGGTSLLPQILATGVGAGAGYLAGGLGTGRPAGSLAPEALVAGGLAAAGQGATGIFKLAFGMGTSQLAQKQVASKLTDLIKSEYGNMGNSPAVLEQIASSPKGIARLTNIGLDGIMTDVDASAQGLKQQVLQAMPAGLSKGAQNTLRAQLSKLTNAGSDMLEGLGNRKTVAASQQAFSDVSQRIQDMIMDDYGHLPQQALNNALMKGQRILQDYWAGLDKYKPGATLLHALKDSGAEEGFNAGKFQQAMMKIAQPQGSFLGEAGDIARRGAPIGSGTDRSAIPASIPVGHMLHLPGILNRLGVGANIGTKYIGNVEGTMPMATGAANAAQTSAIRNFLGESPSRYPVERNQ